MKPALGAAAVGLALIDAGGAEARTQPIDGVRAAGAPAPASSGNAYQDGRALLAQGDTAGAIAAFRTALVASPQSIDALNGLGVAYDRLGRYDLSRSWYDTALAIDPDAVLVLNNLGYSLYLQGQYAAAIPLLQRVAASDDDAARRAGQRVLTLISARMRADAIEGRAPVMVATAPATERRLTPAGYADAARPTPSKAPLQVSKPGRAAPAAVGSRIAQAKPPVVQIEAPAARIEITSSGEQRLVLGGPAPPPELVASLGDAAPMVMVASASTPREESRLAARAAASRRAAQAEQLAAEQAAERAAAARQLAAALDAARHPPKRMASDDAPAAPSLPAEPPPAMVMAAMRVEAPVRPDAELTAQATPAGAPPAPAPAKVRPVVAAPRIQTVDPVEEDAAPAWLLASRRAPRPSEAAVAHDEPVSETTLAFESDDGELNAFAARMRGIEPAKALPSISTEEAVARLEGLLRRLRAA